MPKNLVTDPITDQEIIFARLILSGTMDDRRAAEAAGLNPSTAAYTKAKPRVRVFMAEHRAAVNQKLVNAEADGLRSLSLGRDQILARLWELASLSPEATRGSIAGQMKAMSLIVAMEGLLPNPRDTPASAPPLRPANTQIYGADHVRTETRDTMPDNAMPPRPPQPAATQVSDPATRAQPPRQQSDRSGNVNPFLHPRTAQPGFCRD